MASKSLSALQVVEVNSKGNALSLDPGELENILNQDHIRDRSVVVLSIAGAMRKGKSFMLNFFLRFLYAKYKQGQQSDQWLGNKDDPLCGFSWRGGSKRNTTGILIWPEVFLHDYPNGKKVAIILMDTQGSFDSKTTVDGCVSIFALSNLMSSVQIYNITNNIQQDHLQYLSLFLDYARSAQQNSILEKPFQHLEVLVRDWNFPYEAEYGRQGGYKILKRAFDSSEDTTENQEMKEMIESCFERIDCFLMPYPGKKVATSPDFTGSYADIDEDFLKSLLVLVPTLLNPDKLVVKKINGFEVQAKDFVGHMRNYMKTFTNKSLPTAKSLLSATADAQNLEAISQVKEDYSHLMEKALQSSAYLDYAQLTKLHEHSNIEVQEKFDRMPKIQSGEKLAMEYKADLENGLEKQFYYYLIKNEKNRPDATEQIQTLIDAITEQKEMTSSLTSSNTKMILDLINTVTVAQQENKETILNLTQAFKQSPKEGIGFMDIIMSIITIIPHTLQHIGKFLKK